MDESRTKMGNHLGSSRYATLSIATPLNDSLDPNVILLNCLMPAKDRELLTNSVLLEARKF